MIRASNIDESYFLSSSPVLSILQLWSLKSLFISWTTTLSTLSMILLLNLLWVFQFLCALSATQNSSYIAGNRTNHDHRHDESWSDVGCTGFRRTTHDSASDHRISTSFCRCRTRDGYILLDNVFIPRPWRLCKRAGNWYLSGIEPEGIGKSRHIVFQRVLLYLYNGLDLFQIWRCLRELVSMSFFLLIAFCHLQRRLPASIAAFTMD